jgi:protein-S-isoprenylcysteine O-methyltransferase Ste14
MALLLRAAAVFVGTGAYLGLAILGWGGFAPFFADPARSGLVVVMAALAVASIFTSGNLSPGVREDRANRWLFWPIAVISILSGYLPAWLDRRGLLVLDGEGIRWLGLALTVGGGTLRLWPVFILGRRFSGFVAIQPGHTLVTTGIYGVIRHPSYLGLLTGMLGWALVFRSLVGVLLAVLMLWPILARIAAEERFLRSEFGDAYDAYRARTTRLVPGIY